MKGDQNWVAPDGLTVPDIHQILGLISARTSERILSLRSEGSGAMVKVGELDDPLGGCGHEYELRRTTTGWEISREGQWVA